MVSVENSRPKEIPIAIRTILSKPADWAALIPMVLMFESWYPMHCFVLIWTNRQQVTKTTIRAQGTPMPDYTMQTTDLGLDCFIFYAKNSKSFQQWNEQSYKFIDKL